MNDKNKEIFDDVTERVQTSANIKAVFGEPVEKGGVTIIPVARVSYSGCGCGCMGDKEEECESKQNSGWTRTHAKVIPVGYIELTSDGAYFVEIMEEKRIILAGIALGAFALFSIFRLFNKMLED